MKKEEYTKVIENMNEEYIKLYTLPVYRRYRRNRKIKILLYNLDFKRLYYTISTIITSKFLRYNKKRKKITLNPKRKEGKKVVYTCITGGYDKLYDPLIVTDNVDYIVFSDEESIVEDLKVWQFRRIPKTVMDKANNSPLLANRYIKMHPKEMLPEYDLSLYIDGSIRIISDIEDCFYLTSEKTGLAMHDHFKRDDVYQESVACNFGHLGNKKKIKKVIKKYKKEKFPRKFGMFEATFIGCDLNNEKSKEILDLWWKEFINDGTLRDQMSFTYVLWKNGYRHSDIGLLGTDASKNIKFRRSEHEIKPISIRLRISLLKKSILNSFCKTKLYKYIVRPILMVNSKRKYKGTRYTCNICKSNLKIMLHGGHTHNVHDTREIIGAGYRRNYKCPVCRSKDKDRLVYYYIENYTNMLTEENTILHFAPEFEMKRKIQKNKKAKYYSGDICKGKADIVVDITNICFEDNTFDYIICNHVLEHIEDEEKAIKELKRVIKPTGKIILAVPICVSNENTLEDENITSEIDRLKYFCKENHVRLYSKDIASRLKKYGVKVKEYNIEKEEGHEIRRKHGILENGVIYLITK